MEKGAGILQKKGYLYLTEFFSGMSVMAVELGASRLLAPYFSSSQIVWTIIIGTIMIAMALGNIYGGRRADRDPSPQRLYRRITVAALWIAAIPAVGKYVILGISGVLVLAVNQNFLVWAAFLACGVIFVFPLFLLGTVTPSLAKYATESLEDNGTVVGTLGAFQTVGSIIGTFLPTFVTIPAVGTAVTFLIFAGILLLLSGVYFAVTHTGLRGMLVSGALFLLCCVFGHTGSFAFWEKDLAYEGESVYNYLQVKEEEEQVVLSTNVMFGVQSVMRKDQTLSGMYYDYAMAAPFMAENRQGGKMRMLVLGMGTGTYATQCQRYFPGMEIDGVEIDEKITELSREYFGRQNDGRVAAYDGRAYLEAVDKKYDVIMVDAYQDITIPFQMSSVEFFSLVRKHLTENGVMIVNLNMRGEKKGDINSYLSDTISRVFSDVYTVDVQGSTNRELFASNAGGMLQRLDENRQRESRKELAELMGRVSKRLVRYTPGDYLLTDDKAPVELLGMQMIDRLIQEELSYYRDVFQREGLSGLLEYL